MEKRKWGKHRLTFILPALFSVFPFLFSLPLLDAQSKKSQPTDKRENVELLVVGGTVVTMDGQRRVIEGGAVAVRGDSIVAVGPSGEVEGKYRAARRINAAGQIVMPGLINGHGHAPMTLLRGKIGRASCRERV